MRSRLGAAHFRPTALLEESRRHLVARRKLAPIQLDGPKALKTQAFIGYSLTAVQDANFNDPAKVKPLQRMLLLVRGVVQGVGFRPFVYRLASEEHLAGFIGNDTGGVTIEIEGPAERVEAFRRRLREEAPPLSRIDRVTHEAFLQDEKKNSASSPASRTAR